MRDDWALVDFARAFMPNWMSKAMSLKVVSVVALALIVFMVVMKVVRA
jgi:hypothetical protein